MRCARTAQAEEPLFGWPAMTAVGRSRRPFCEHRRHCQSLDDVIDRHEEHVDHVFARETEEREGESEEDGLRARLSRLLSSEEMADVHFVVGEEKKLRIPAHRLILSLASPAMARQLASAQDIEVRVEPKAFLEFLRFLYTDRMCVSAEHVVSVLWLAKHFSIACLERTCVQFIARSLDGRNCLWIWMGARKHALHEWTRVSHEVIRTCASEALNSRAFLRLDLDSLKELLEDDELRAPEVHVFLSACRWAKSACLSRGLCPTRHAIRETLTREVVDLIRFPLMSDQEIRRHVQTEGVLDEEAVRALLSTHRTWPSRAARAFNAIPRAYSRLQCPPMSVQRFDSFDNQLNFRSPERELLFSADKDLFLVAFGVYGPRKTADLQIDFSVAKILDSTEPEIACIHRKEHSFVVRVDGSQPVIQLQFPDPFRVEANHVHRLHATLNTCSARAKDKELDFFYGIRPKLAARQRVRDSRDHVVFSFLSEDSSPLVNSVSAPSTPNPPPRPPPPKEYRRPSRIERLKRALSFSERSHLIGCESAVDVSCGQIAVIQFLT